MRLPSIRKTSAIPRHRSVRGRRGITIIELIIVLAIMGIVAVLTVPNLRVWTSRMRLQGATTHLRSSIVNTRKMAVTTANRYCMSFTGDTNYASASDSIYLITTEVSVETAPLSGLWTIVTAPVELAGWSNDSNTELYKGITLEDSASTTSFVTTSSCVGLLFNNKGFLDNPVDDFPLVNGGRYAKLTLRNKSQGFLEQRTLWIDRGGNVRITQEPSTAPNLGTN
jgi:prepilin-type N-terminal cleavage/methylation domain-containing protein